MNLHYFFDEKDIGGLDGKTNSKSIGPINDIYRRTVPHYDFPENMSEGIYQKIQIGNTLIISLDSWSFMDIEISDNATNKTLFGRKQLEWLNSTLSSAKADDTIEAILITMTQLILYNKERYEGDMLYQNYWSISDSYEEERQIFKQAIDTINYKNRNESDFKSVLVISGGRMLALDTGINNIYGDFPTLVCGNLDLKGRGTCNGGPWSHGYFYEDQPQICLIGVYPNDNKTCIKATGLILDEDLQKQDLPVFIYDSCEEDHGKALDVKCPMTKPEKLILVFSSLAISIILFLLFYFICYNMSKSRFRYKHFSNNDEENRKLK